MTTLSLICWAFIFLLVFSTPVTGTIRRCWACRSRGEYGDCRDPFRANLYNLDLYPQVTAAPCASGWCAKIIEGNEIQYSVATERMCLTSPPPDGQERCAETQWKYQRVYMCFCMGDLCNGVSTTTASSAVILIGFIIQWILL